MHMTIGAADAYERKGEDLEQPGDEFERACYEHVKETGRGYLRADGTELTKRAHLTHLYLEREGAAETGDLMRDRLRDEPLYTLLVNALARPIDEEPQKELAEHVICLACAATYKEIDAELRRWEQHFEVLRERQGLRR